MKKVLAVVILVLLAAGCMAPAAPRDATAVPAAPAAPASPAKSGIFYFVGANIADPFYVPGWAGFQAGAKEAGYTAKFVGPSDLNLASQMATIEQISAAPDTAGIMLYAMDAAATKPFTLAAIKRGVPVVYGIAKPPFAGYTASIGYDNNMLGETAAEEAVKLVGDKAKVGTIGVTGVEVGQRRARFESYLKEKYPGMTVYPTVTHDGSAAGGAKTLDAYVAAHPDMDLVWWADGVSSQMVQVWKDKQAAGVKTKFMSMDMPQPTIKAVCDGVYVASIGQDTFTEELWGAKLLAAAKNGERVPQDIYMAAIVVTKDNCKQFVEK